MVHSVHTIRHLRDMFKCTCKNAIKRCRVQAYMKKAGYLLSEVEHVQAVLELLEMD